VKQQAGQIESLGLQNEGLLAAISYGTETDIFAPAILATRGLKNFIHYGFLDLGRIFLALRKIQAW
jgi:hypothetical protein